MSSRSRPNPRSAPLELVAPRSSPISAVLVEIGSAAENEEGLAPFFLADEEDRGEADNDQDESVEGAEVVDLAPEKGIRATRGRATVASASDKAAPRKPRTATAGKTSAAGKTGTTTTSVAKLAAAKSAVAKTGAAKTAATKTAATKTAGSKTAGSKTAGSKPAAPKTVGARGKTVVAGKTAAAGKDGAGTAGKLARLLPAAKGAPQPADVEIAGAKPGTIAKPGSEEAAAEAAAAAKKPTGPEVRVRRLHRRDLNRTWEFLKLVFRDVNRETVEYQRPRSKRRFFDVYEEEGEQLLFDVEDQIVGYAECSFDASGVDNWINPRYFEKRGMRPLYVDELAVHPAFQGKGVGGFMLDQLQHLARVRGCTHLVLEVAENNNSALTWYRRRNFFKLDAAIFLAQKVPAEPELLPPRRLPQRRNKDGSPTTGTLPARKSTSGTKRGTKSASSRTSRKR